MPKVWTWSWLTFDKKMSKRMLWSTFQTLVVVYAAGWNTNSKLKRLHNKIYWDSDSIVCYHLLYFNHHTYCTNVIIWNSVKNECKNSITGSSSIFMSASQMKKIEIVNWIAALQHCLLSKYHLVFAQTVYRFAQSIIQVTNPSF